MAASPRIWQEYTTCLTKVFKNTRRGALDLCNPRKIQARMQFPDRCYKTIHVGGTNGKGSVCTKLARALEYSGLRVGLFLTPHINSIRERISINSELISEEEMIEIVDYVEKLESMEDQITVSFFELMFFAAVEHFKRQKVDVAVIEVGLGGRLDATNIITPSVSVITNVSLDHTRLLGSTVPEIALEKAGIIKPNIPIVLGPGNPIGIMEEVAHERGAPVHIVPATKIKDYDAENAGVSSRVIEIFAELHPELLPDPYQPQVREGLTKKPPCRMEGHTLTLPWIPNCDKTFNVLLDVGHNAAGIQAFFDSLLQRYPNRRYRIVFGMCADKAVDVALNLIGEHAMAVHFVKASGTSRGALGSDLLSDFMRLPWTKQFEGNMHAQMGEGEESFTAEVQKAAFLSAFSSEDEKEKELLCIIGSFFVVAEARTALLMEVPVDPPVKKEFLIPQDLESDFQDGPGH